MHCNAARLTAKGSPAQEKMKNRIAKYKPSGEGVLFESIWNTRKHFSFIDGTFLGDEAKAWFFGHVLPKSIAPEMRLFDRNIVLLTQDQHYSWDSMSRELLRSLPEWDKMFKLEESLKKTYNKLYRHA
jgi:hypothetical protein